MGDHLARLASILVTLSIDLAAHMRMLTRPVIGLLVMMMSHLFKLRFIRSLLSFVLISTAFTCLECPMEECSCIRGSLNPYLLPLLQLDQFLGHLLGVLIQCLILL